MVQLQGLETLEVGAKGEAQINCNGINGLEQFELRNASFSPFECYIDPKP